MAPLGGWFAVTGSFERFGEALLLPFFNLFWATGFDIIYSTLDEKFENVFVRKMKSDAFLIKEILVYRLSRFLDNERLRPIKEILCLEKVFENRHRLVKSEPAVDVELGRLVKHQHNERNDQQ